MATGEEGPSLNIENKDQIVQCAGCWKHVLPGVSMGNVTECSESQLRAQITCMFFQMRRMLDVQVQCFHYVREVVQMLSLLANTANYTMEGMGKLEVLSKDVGWIFAKDGGWVNLGGVFAELCRLLQNMVTRNSESARRFVHDMQGAAEHQLSMLIRRIDLGALCLHCVAHCGHHEGHELGRVYGKVMQLSIKGDLLLQGFNNVYFASTRSVPTFQKSDFDQL